jgi:hypothetical protein
MTTSSISFGFHGMNMRERTVPQRRLMGRLMESAIP